MTITDPITYSTTYFLSKIQNIQLTEKEATSELGQWLKIMRMFEQEFKSPSLSSPTILPPLREFIKQIEKSIDMNEPGLNVNDGPAIPIGMAMDRHSAFLDRKDWGKQAYYINRRIHKPSDANKSYLKFMRSTIGQNLIRNVENMARQEQEAARSHYLHYYSALQRADPEESCNKRQDWIVTVYIDSVRRVPFERYREIECREYQGAVLCNHKWQAGMNYIRISPFFPWRIRRIEKQKNPDDHSQHEPPLFQFFRDHDVEFKIWPVTEYQATIPEAQYTINDFWEVLKKIPFKYFDLELLAAETLRIYQNLLKAKITGTIYAQSPEWEAYLAKINPSKPVISSPNEKEYIKTGSMMATNPILPSSPTDVKIGPETDPAKLEEAKKIAASQNRRTPARSRKPVDVPAFDFKMPYLPTPGEPRQPYPMGQNIGDDFKRICTYLPGLLGLGFFLMRNQLGAEPIAANDARPWVKSIWQEFAHGPITATYILPSSVEPINANNLLIPSPFIMTMDFLGEEKLQENAIKEFRKRWGMAIKDPEVANQPFATWVQQAPLAVGLGYVLPEAEFEVQWVRPKYGLPEVINFDYENDERKI